MLRENSRNFEEIEIFVKLIVVILVLRQGRLNNYKTAILSRNCNTFQKHIFLSNYYTVACLKKLKYSMKEGSNVTCFRIRKIESNPPVRDYKFIHCEQFRQHQSEMLIHLESFEYYKESMTI